MPCSFLIRPISHATRARSFSSRTRTSSTRSMSSRNSSNVRMGTFEPTYVFLDLRDQVRRTSRLADDRDERAADDGRIRVFADFGDVFGTRDAEAERNRQRRPRANAPHERFRAAGDTIPRAGDAE